MPVQRSEGRIERETKITSAYVDDLIQNIESFHVI